ncbi:MAG: ATP-dependent 23S rRNA helicase DbpA [uncultured Sulfurovum sp.]|uniref:ATP-dependent 23S rRNA helicase DbpA n=1 Tax=uncultured Sulfurovum sp. TaxID=269237 RepID=A0A6S6T8U4_9BACT|nr:MAG: ATP-dependent 23S rRNA helicase DbpA [uncultured Sulfurovum sp.]
MITFQNLSLPANLLENLTSLGYEQPTPIQEQTIPLLRENKDLIAQAKTGSGKTLAFLLPLILKLDEAEHFPQALIIAPTRELCEQIAGEANKLARYKKDVKVTTLYGGTSLTKQVASLEKGADILIGTPGRLLDHFSRKTIHLGQINTLILDEADRMLDMGFADDILKLVSNLPKKRQSILFSATYPENIDKLTKVILKNPTEVKIASKEKEVAIEEFVYEVEDKDKALLTTLKHFQPNLALIFCNTKIKTAEVSHMLQGQGFDVATLNGDLEQYERQEMLLQFTNGSLPVLVATDLAARGLDIENIDLVINYDTPMKTEDYTHRIGRTGRADKSGLAVTLCDTYGLGKLSEIKPKLQAKKISTLSPNKNFYMQGEVATLCIDGGKKKKVRAGDILGTLCKDIGINGKDIGKINIYQSSSYVAIKKTVIKKAFTGLKNGKIKGKNLRVWWLD